MKVLCALNPTASSGLAKERWPQIEDLFKSFGFDYDVVESPDIPLDKQLVTALKDPKVRYDVVAGIGGDGTHSMLLNALMRFKLESGKELPSYAIIPMGTGNDIAKSFGLNNRQDFFVNDLRRAVSTIVYGADYKLDMGVLNNDSYFVDAFTIGLDPRILQDHNKRKAQVSHIPILKRILRGPLLYALSTSRTFLRQTLVEAEIKVDGKIWYTGHLLNLVINNTRIYAGEFDFASEAYANDGKLDIVLFTEHYDYLGKYLLSFRQHPLQIRKMADSLNEISTSTQGQHIEISINESAPAQIDGEELPDATHFDLKVIPNCINLKTPAEP
jgi:diacylglycerol kinase family enzyme